MTTHPLPINLKNLMLEIQDAVGLNEFILYGSTPVDLLLGKIGKPHDVDIITKDVAEDTIDGCKKRLVYKGFELIVPRLDYFVYKDQKVVMIIAENKNWRLDVGFFDKPELVGQFDAETLYCRYPELDYIDRFDTIGAIKRKTLKPVRGLENENPYMLLSRFIYLCAKYDIPLNSSSHRDILFDLKGRMKTWVPVNYFHGPRAQHACISAILKSILRSRAKERFVRELQETSIVGCVFPELQIAISNLKNSGLQKMNKTETKCALVSLFLTYLDGPDKTNFMERIKSLKERTWDKEDAQLTNYL